MVPLAVPFVIEALRSMTQLASQREEHRHTEAMFSLRATLLKDLVDAVITKRIATAERQCNIVLEMFAEQAREYMAIRTKYSDRFLSSRDELERTDLKPMIAELDKKLEDIRADCKLIHDRMGALMLAIGGSGLTLVGDLSRTLALPSTISR